MASSALVVSFGVKTSPRLGEERGPTAAVGTINEESVANTAATVLGFNILVEQSD